MKIRRSPARSLHRQLGYLRSVVPSNSDSTQNWSVLLDTVHYIQDMKEQIQDLRDDMETPSSQIPFMASDPRQSGCPDSNAVVISRRRREREAYVQVMDREAGLEVHLSCDKRPGLLVAVMEALDGFGLTFRTVDIQCLERLKLDGFDAQNSEGTMVEAAAVRNALLRIILETDSGDEA